MKWNEIIPVEAMNIGYGLAAHAQQEREDGKQICPPQNQIFRALELTPPDKVRVVVVGQDPYHDGSANGLAFSADRKIPPSLNNIFTELANDIGCGRPTTGDLTPWAERGVLLLNTALTVYEHQANSHAHWGWQRFTSAVLRATISQPQPIVYLLFGSNAQSLMKVLIIKAATYSKDNKVVMQRLIKKAIIQTSHPSPLSARKMCHGTPAFIGSKPFSLANSLLMDMGGEGIDWRL